MRTDNFVHKNDKMDPTINDVEFVEVKKKQKKSKIIAEPKEPVRNPTTVISIKEIHIYYKHHRASDEVIDIADDVNIFLVSHGYRPGFLTRFRHMKTFSNYGNVFTEVLCDQDIFNPLIYIYNEDTKSKYKHLIDECKNSRNTMSNLLLGYPCLLPPHGNNCFRYNLYIKIGDDYVNLFGFLSNVYVELSHFEIYNEGIHHYNSVNNTNYKFCISNEEIKW